MAQIHWVDAPSIQAKPAENIQEPAENIQAKQKKILRLEKKFLNCIGRAVADFGMIKAHDKILVCVSGGKDSITMVLMLDQLRKRANVPFEIMAFTLDQAQPGWDDLAFKAFLSERSIPFQIITRDTYSIVKEKIPEGATYCGLCSRLRRGIIYNYAREHGFNKVALGHHRDDLITTLLMSIFYNGEIRSMPPKLLTDDQSLMVIRPLSYCQEADIRAYSELLSFPIIPCNLCGSQENLARKKTARLIAQLASENPKIPSNMLHALTQIRPSQLMDADLWDFKSLEQQQKSL